MNIKRSLNFTVYKYPLIIGDFQEIELPHGSQILKVDTQFGSLSLWARVNLNNKMVKKEIYMYGTGHPLFDVNQTYIGTIMLNNDKIVFHLYAGVDKY